jgi:hypothetical protein
MQKNINNQLLRKVRDVTFFEFLLEASKAKPMKGRLLKRCFLIFFLLKLVLFVLILLKIFLMKLAGKKIQLALPAIT